jgi:hypothetical protein
MLKKGRGWRRREGGKEREERKDNVGKRERLLSC